MKKIYFILIAMLGLTVQSCLMEEKELFDSTPAERMEAYLDEYRTLLASAEEGWLLQYFPEETQAYGGYTYILEFTRDSVAAYFELADKIEEPVASLYKMTPDDGPVITFDTYNENIHFFATPNISDYEAMHGDYEFRIVGKNDDETEIYMRGKRTNNNYTLVKFSGDPVEYLGKINEVNAAMEAPAYRMVMDSDTTVCSIKGNVFEFEYNVYTEQDTTAVAGSASFCYTPTGVDFYAPVEINGTEYTKFVFNAENGTLATEDGKVLVCQVIPPLNEMFVIGNWFIKYSTLGPEGQYYFDIVKQYLDAMGEELQYAFIGSMLYPGNFGFQFVSSGYGGSLNFNYVLEDEDIITLQFAMAGVGNGVWYHNNAGFKYALYPFGYSSSRTFKLTADDKKNPTQITMTEVGKEAHSMTLFAAQIANPYNN